MTYGNAFGSAHWATQQDINNTYELFLSETNNPSRDALILGKFIEYNASEIVRSRFGASTVINHAHPALRCWQQDVPVDEAFSWSKRTYLQLKGQGHVITFAGTRAGKGVGLVLPNLISWGGAMFVFDPKSENFLITHSVRKKLHNQPVYLFDPFKQAEKAERALGMDNERVSKFPYATFATLARAKALYDAFVESGDTGELFAEASRIAEAIVVRQNEERETFFNDSSQILIKNAIVLVLYLFEKTRLTCPPLSKICSVLHLEKLEELEKELDASFPESKAKEYNLPLLPEGEIELKRYETLKECIRECKDLLGNRDVCVTLRIQLEFLQDTNVADLLDGKSERVFYPQYGVNCRSTIYLTIPPHYLTRHIRVSRLILSALLDAATQSLNDRNFQWLFLLDEVANFGSLPQLARVASLGAGYNIILWMLWQDMAQLRGLYSDNWETFMANARVQQYFGVRDKDAAKLISELSGMREARFEQSTYGRNVTSTGWFNTTYTETESVAEQRVAAPLIRPEEVVRTPSELMFMFAQGVAPILGERLTFTMNQTRHGSQLENREPWLLDWHNKSQE